MRATACVLVADEFAAVLDRVTAMVVARALRRAIDASAGLCAVVASSHDDLEAALLPDVVVRCDFSRWSVGEPRRREAVKEARRRD
jgi:ABC-type ATPase with predicted acetyltransferase domain